MATNPVELEELLKNPKFRVDEWAEQKNQQLAEKMERELAQQTRLHEKQRPPTSS